MTDAAPKAQPILLFCSDLDGTLLGNPEAAQRFKEAWEALPRRGRPLLVYASGRLEDDIRRLVDAAELPAPACLIAGVGTQVHDFHRRSELKEFTRRLNEGWDLRKIHRVLKAFEKVQPQPAEFLTAFKSSWYLNHATTEQLDAIRAALAQAGLDVNL
ncbi:MAG TPA: HAD family hydrolase, partial [Burkholderiaceae bacterium]